MAVFVLGIGLIAIGIVFVFLMQVILLNWYKKFNAEWEEEDDLSEL